MNDFYVYIYLRSNDSKNGKAGTPYYIGKGRGNRALDKTRHTHRPKELSNIVFVAVGLTEPNAFQLEMLLIHLHGRIDKGTGCLRNRTDGGEGQHGVPHPKSEAWKQWMREHPNKSWFKPGHTISNGCKGRKLTEEHKRKVSIAGKGRTVSQDSRAKISSALMGHPVSDETLTKLSASHKGRPWSAKRRKAYQKPTHCLHGHEFTPENTRLKMRKYGSGVVHSVRICKRCDHDHKVRARERENSLKQCA